MHLPMLFQVNVPTVNKQTIRWLAAILTEASMDENRQMRAELAENWSSLLKECTTDSVDLQLEFLYGVQAFSCDLKHPPGKNRRALSLPISTMFEHSLSLSGLLGTLIPLLYKTDGISKQAFLEWRYSPEGPGGEGSRRRIDRIGSH